MDTRLDRTIAASGDILESVNRNINIAEVYWLKSKVSFEPASAESLDQSWDGFADSSNYLIFLLDQ